MSDAAFLRILAEAMVREVVGTSPNLAEQERAVLAGLSALSGRYGGERVRLYVPKVGTDARVRRARQIRATWNGRNVAALAAQYGISERQVRRIVGTSSA